MLVNINGTTIFYRTAGTGSPLILLHGNGEDHHIFDKIIEKLEGDFSIYAIDSRNHGQSMKTGDYSYETMSEDIYAFIQALKLEKVNVVGFSDGAIVSLILAMNHGESIEKMALLGVNLKPEDFTEKSYQFIMDTYKETSDPLFRLMLEQPNIELKDVEKVKTPSLIIAADNDIFKPETFVKLTEALPNAELKIMKNHEHDSYIVDQDILYADFIHFFK
ncbi:alpha/beta hydrolase [Paenibacillus sp. SYP-B3998]|uniref:Alpha/beta hydrolase n=1 Tax=Paenibacillus sp. SYP-B3998 TaxID=2678564 RepID=A0A6G3ZR94_9BACL|nr:alpha/beta hydrolase [Paenibacillus sp. SYP-B3998]NEW04652.1 alpha/beta hydrolase [Paenibacillus sp. SYP-B3998]